ncbi:MAG: hypothetical protein R2828_03610 [Saprospiraceae bacterium]
MKNFQLVFLSVFLLGALILNSGCKKEEEPPIENEEEIITDIILTFTPAGGGASIIATAQDPDGEGVQDLQITKNIELLSNTTYTMSIKLENNIEMEDITKEVEEEGDEHLFFFEFTPDIFSNPSGNGNTDNRADPVNYNDADKNGIPIGLSTTWTTGDVANGASFRIVLKHQPDVKSASSSITDGGTDVDLTWPLTIQ